MYNGVYVELDDGKFVGGVVGEIDVSHINFTYEHKTRCPSCELNGNDNSGDNLHVYAPYKSKLSGAKCFACGFAVPSMQHIIDGDGQQSKSTKSKVKSEVKVVANVTDKDYIDLREKRLSAEDIETLLSSTSHEPNGRRGLSAEVCLRHGVRFGNYEDSNSGLPKKMFYPAFITENGEPVITGYHVREFPKTFSAIGYVGKLCLFGGQHLRKNVTKTLIIVGGQIDLLTAEALLQQGLGKYKHHFDDITIVTPMTGEASVVNTIRVNSDWVLGHKKIILALDNDDAGREATRDVIDLLGSDRVLLANLRHKDANDYIKNRVGSYEAANEFTKDVYWDAQPCEDFGVIGSDVLYEGALEKLSQEKIPFPPFLGDLARCFTDGSIGRGEWINIISNTSTGKSTIVDAWSHDWALRSPYKQAIMTFEADTKSYGLKVANLVLNRAVHQISGVENRIAYLEEHKESVMDFLKTEDGSSRFLFVEKIPSTLDAFKRMVLYLVRMQDVGVLWIDPFVNLKTMCQSDKEMDDLILFLDRVRMEYDLTIIAVVHTRKTLLSGGAGSAGAEIQEEDAYGSRALISAATVNITLTRDKNSEDEVLRNTTFISVRKNRPDSITGTNVAAIYYRIKANKLYPYSYAESKGFFKDDIFCDVEDIVLDDGAGFHIGHIAETQDAHEEEIKAIDSFIMQGTLSK